ncbi:MAG: hypothetical protein V3U27_21950 [Candidatus Tectomicrobia bacterium]
MAASVGVSQQLRIAVMSYELGIMQASFMPVCDMEIQSIIDQFIAGKGAGGSGPNEAKILHIITKLF